MRKIIRNSGPFSIRRLKVNALFINGAGWIFGATSPRESKRVPIDRGYSIRE